MKKYLKLMQSVIILSLIIFFSVSCNDSEGSNKTEDTDNQPSTFVKVGKLEAKPFTQYITILGVAKPMYQANLSAEEGGTIKEFLKNKGSYVNQGDVILIMDNEVLKANLDAAKAQYEMAENNFVRQEQIYKDNVTSELQYLNSKYERDGALANYELTKARYEKTFIKAPFAGIIDQKFVEVGELILPGSPIVSVVSMHSIKVVAGVPENYVNLVQRGDKAKIVFKDLLGIEYHEKLTYVGNTITTSNRTFPVEIILRNSDLRIKPELSAQVFVETANYESVFIIPEETVSETDFGPAVFIEKDGKAVMRIVNVLSRSENKVVVDSGLSAGEHLIIVGYQNLVDGEKIKVLN